MRVVHVSDCFLPRLGGIEIQLAELARMQQRAGHEVEVVTATPDRTGQPTASPVPVHRVDAGLPWELPIHPRMGHHLAALYRTLRPDVVHVHVGAVSPFAWSAVRQAALLRLPTVVTVHSLWDHGTSAIYRILDAGAGWTGWPGVCTAVSEAAAAPIRRVVDGRVPVHVVANGINTAQWQIPGQPVAAPPVHHDAGELHLVAVGRLAPRKQPLTLLRILRTARQGLAPSTPPSHVAGRANGQHIGRPTDRVRGVRLRATIVGDGPARSWMERYLRRHAMTDWVSLTGRLDRTQVRAVLDDADVFLAPARRESFGLAALEARMSGVPVVGYAESGITAFVRHEREGLLAGSADEMAAAVVRLGRDLGLRSRMAAHNRATEPVHCTWPVVLGDFDERYAQAMARVLAPSVS